MRVELRQEIQQLCATHPPTAHSEGARHHGVTLTTRPKSEVDASLRRLVTPLLLLPEMCCRFFNCSKDNCKKTGGPTFRAGLTAASFCSGGSGPRKAGFSRKTPDLFSLPQCPQLFARQLQENQRPNYKSWIHLLSLGGTGKATLVLHKKQPCLL